MKVYTKTVITEKEVFAAEDGTEFDSLWQCEDYENEKMQLENEKKVDILAYDANKFDWASMTNPDSKHVYKWFKVKNDKDLKLFCDGYYPYNRGLKDFENVKRYVNYPDYVCLVDYPEGPEDPEWFTLSRLLEQTNVFLSQFPFDENGCIC